MIDPKVTAAALATSEVHTAKIRARAEHYIGRPEHESALILAEASQRITNNLRAVHEAHERRNP